MKGWFEEIFVSAEMGMTKPDGCLFAAAAERLGLDGPNILHVGDSRREDLQGALNAGWQGRLLVRTNNHQTDSEGQIAPSLMAMTKIIKET